MVSTIDLCASAGLPTQTLAPGETVIQEDRKDGKIYILKSGAVEVQRRHTEVNRAASPGSIFGEIAVLLDIAHTATVVTLETCEFYVAEDGEEFLRAHPELNLKIARLMAHRLQRVTKQLVEIREQIEATGQPLGHVDGVLNSLVDQM